MIYNKEILSLFGGSYDKYMEFQSFYTIHWELIKYALNNGFEKYNFYGITGDFKDTKDELYGIYEDYILEMNSSTCSNGEAC